MRTLIILGLNIIILLLIACNQKDSTDREQKDNEILTGFVAVEDSIIRSDLKSYAGSYLETRAYNENIYFRILNELENYSLVRIPFFELDKEKFYEDPSPDGIIRYLIPLKDEVVFCGNDEFGRKFRLGVQKRGDRWTPGIFIEGWGELISWLPEKLKQSDDYQYQIFTFCNSEFFVLYLDGKPVIYDINGQEQEQHRLCESFLNIIKQIKQTEGLILF